MEQVFTRLIFVALVLIAGTAVLYMRHNHRYRKNGPKTRINKHGLKYQFVPEIGKWHKLRFYDEKAEDWVYVMGSSIDFEWYGSQFDYRVYKAKSFGSDRDYGSKIDWYRSIEQLIAENERAKAQVAESNAMQDRFREADRIRREKQGF